MNEDYYHEQNPCYDSNSFGFDQFQPPQYTVNHPIFNAQNEFLNSQNKLMEQMTSMCDMGDILFLERLLYDNSSPRPPEEFNFENPTESFSPSPIPVEDSDSLIEEIDIFLNGDDSIPPGMESDDFDSEDDDNSTFRPEFESFHVDYPDLGDSTIDVVERIP
ncbi:hypothetical protein Tco_0289373 [Tanacetum coccineum]